MKQNKSKIDNQNNNEKHLYQYDDNRYMQNNENEENQIINQPIKNFESKETLKHVMNEHLKQMDIDAIRCKQKLETIGN
jgi:hypothetical protein